MLTVPDFYRCMPELPKAVLQHCHVISAAFGLTHARLPAPILIHALVSGRWQEVRLAKLMQSFPQLDPAQEHHRDALHSMLVEVCSIQTPEASVVTMDTWSVVDDMSDLHASRRFHQERPSTHPDRRHALSFAIDWYRDQRRESAIVGVIYDLEGDQVIYEATPVVLMTLRGNQPTGRFIGVLPERRLTGRGGEPR